MSMPGRTESFFHGTTNDIVGGVVRPGVEVGQSTWGRTGSQEGQPSEEHAFATTDESEAWRFAAKAHQAKLSYSKPADRARVYTVAPHPEMQPGIYNPSHPQHGERFDKLHEWVAPEFKVTGRLDVAPGYQGTFPTINWRQFAHPDIWGDPNHPTPHEVAEGMRFAGNSPSGQRQAREAREAAVRPNPVRVTSNQMDRFTGRTAGEHRTEAADFDREHGGVKYSTDLGRYHAGRLRREREGKHG